MPFSEITAGVASNTSAVLLVSSVYNKVMTKVATHRRICGDRESFLTKVIILGNKNILLIELERPAEVIIATLKFQI